ncbi:MAG: YlmC/YmxH family sporulation protein [Bacilli bacterium]|nr:YlmC/YmxH family sporulation protein [Bacilli bacterium]
MNIFLSEMQDKQVISIINGMSYGKIIDVEINENGQIMSIIAENHKMFRKSFKNEEVSFKFSDIEKIGKDVILVKV